ncbi:MAG: carbon storage regulator [Planctomycetaceae bacterium]|nr:carbon storage regulator [Planctomycetaceae bacterium]|tara:strand:- start:11030 stop:11260 length:231 start_codon:yes stop_codon:yes gene_type:complete
MLVISRRQGESVWIGDQIKVVVCTMRGKRVSLGIAAPRDVSVVRDELRQSDLEKALAASGLTGRQDLEITQSDLLR